MASSGLESCRQKRREPSRSLSVTESTQRAKARPRRFQISNPPKPNAIFRSTRSGAKAYAIRSDPIRSDPTSDAGIWGRAGRSIGGGNDHYVRTLPSEQNGTHKSRFLAVLNEHHDSLSSDTLSDVCCSMKEKLRADELRLELEFPYFIDKKAPVSGQSGKLDIDITFDMTSNGTNDFILGIKVPATSLCPCSKEISDYGAHSQRCEMTVNVRVAEGQYL